MTGQHTKESNERDISRDENLTLANRDNVIKSVVTKLGALLMQFI